MYDEDILYLFGHDLARQFDIDSEDRLERGPGCVARSTLGKTSMRPSHRRARPASTKCIESNSVLVQDLPLHLGRIDGLHPLKILQPAVLLELVVGRPLQTPPRDVTIRLDIVDERLERHVVVLGPDEAQHEQVQGGAVEVVGEVVQQVDLDAAHRVLVERVEADAQHRRVHGRVARGRVRRRRQRQAHEAVVHAGVERWVCCEALGGDVGRGDAELYMATVSDAGLKGLRVDTRTAE